MKQEDRRRAWMPFYVSAVLFAVAGAAVQYMYGKTLYVPFFLLALLMYLPLALTLFVWVFRRREGGAEKPTEAPPAPEARLPEVAAPPPVSDPRKAFMQKWMARLRRGFALVRRGVVTGYKRSRRILRLVCLVGSFALFGYLFFTNIVTRNVGSRMTVRYPICLLIIFVVFIILDKWLKHTETEDRFCHALLHNLRSAMAVARIALLFGIVISGVRAMGYADWQKYLIYIYVGVFCYQAAFLLFSLAVRFVRRDLSVSPMFSVPVPFMTAGDSELSLVGYLEESTGITMRSLWSIKLIRYILPYTVIGLTLVIWLSTGIVQVESYQEGAVYRFGRLQEETLSPGLHFTFPAPIDKVELYDTGVVNKMTIGYRSEEVGDNIWTAAHGETEYKLLLGNGNEVVSINLRLEYKIGDLQKYLRGSACAECVLEAMAYELVTDRTISTDLNTLLSTDRAAFASTYQSELVQRLGAYDTGLEIVSVVLESIHPPLEIAEYYQLLVSAEITAKQYLLDAEATYAVTVANAQTTRALTIGDAQANYYSRVAAAKAAVAEFMAAVEANNAYPDAYQYYKYLEAVSKAYNNARIVIVGDGVDTENLYFGNMIIG